MKNEYGDIVFYFLIKYVDDYFEKMEYIKLIFKFLWKYFLKFCELCKKRKKYMKIIDIFFWENNFGLILFELFVKFGVSEFF